MVDQYDTKTKQNLFLEAFCLTGVIKEAANAAGIHRNTVHYWLEHDTEFESQYALAIEDANDVVRLEIRRRAFGFPKELHYQGRKTGDTVEEYDSGMLSMLAKSRMPKEFRQNVAVESSESSDLMNIRERFLDRLAMMAERLAEE